MSKLEKKIVEDIWKDENCLVNIFQFLGWSDLVNISLVSKHVFVVSQADVLWKNLSIQFWDELKHATEVEKDPFPAWKSCFIRKFGEKGTSFHDVMEDSEFSHCDWYSCPNGHLYMIGECRLPMIFSRCTECGERIGGRSHQMLRGNSRYGSVNTNHVDKDEAKKIKFEKIESKVRGTTNSNNFKYHVNVFDYDGDSDGDDDTWMNFMGNNNDDNNNEEEDDDENKEKDSEDESGNDGDNDDNDSDDSDTGDDSLFIEGRKI